MERLRMWTRRGALTLALALVSGGLFGCSSTNHHDGAAAATTQMQMMQTTTTRPTLYEVRRGPSNAPVVIAYFTDANGSGKVIYGAATNLSTDYGKMDIFIKVGEVEPNFDLCAVFKNKFTNALVADWSSKVKNTSNPQPCGN